MQLLTTFLQTIALVGDHINFDLAILYTTSSGLWVGSSEWKLPANYKSSVHVREMVYAIMFGEIL